MGLVLFLALLTHCEAPEVQVRREIAPSVNRGSVAWLDPEDLSTWEGSSRPYFLFLHARKSFWSHHMAETVFTDPEITLDLNDVTQPVWIDADLRPDLLDRYGTGGLPGVAVLTQDLRWITGTTYRGPEDVRALLRRVRILHDVPERREDLERERRRLLDRFPVPVASYAQRGDAADVLAGLIQRIASTDVATRSGEARVLLREVGRSEEPVDLDALSRQLNPDGMLVSSVLSEDGRVRDETVSLGVNADAIYVLGQSADSEARTVGKRLLATTIAQLYDEASGLFFTGIADFTVTDGKVRPGPGSTPLYDDRRITAENALLVSAICAMRDSVNAVLAREVLDRLLEDRVRPGGVTRTGIETTFQLEDVAHLTRACIDFADVFGERGYIDRARVLVKEVLPILPRGENSGGASPSRPLQTVAADNWYGAGVGVMAQCLVRLESTPDGGDFRREAERLCRTAIERNAERPGRLGAVGRALYLMTR